MATLAARVLPSLPPSHPCVGCDVRKVAVCGVLNCADLAELRCLGGTQSFEAGQPLFHEGDPAGQVFNVTSGAVKLYKLLPDGRRQVMGFMFPGDFLGITIDDEHAFSAEALARTKLCRFTRQRFDDFVDEHPELEREMYRLAAHELAAAQAQMVLLGRKSASERLSTFLLDLLDRRERASGRPHRAVDLPMSRTDIADYLGLTKETISRVLALLKRRRLIRLVSLNEIEILDRDRLCELAEGLADG